MPVVTKKGICIVNSTHLYGGISNLYQRMKEELSELGVSLELRSANEAKIRIEENGAVSTALGEADFVLYLDKDKYASYALERAGYHLFNSSRSIALCDDKMLTYIALSNQDIKMPKTISPSLDYKGNPMDEKSLAAIATELGYPLVAKTNYGSLGNGVYLVKNHAELQDFECKFHAIPRLYQEFISSSCGVDYRVIVIGGRFCVGMKRINEDDFRSNVARGGKGKRVEIPKPFIDMAEKAAKLLKLDYCGVDLLIGEHGEPVLCEVNSNAFIKGIEEVTGYNVAKDYSAHIAKTLGL